MRNENNEFTGAVVKQPNLQNDNIDINLVVTSKPGDVGVDMNLKYGFGENHHVGYKSLPDADEFGTVVSTRLKTYVDFMLWNTPSDRPFPSEILVELSKISGCLIEFDKNVTGTYNVVTFSHPSMVVPIRLSIFGIFVDVELAFSCREDQCDYENALHPLIEDLDFMGNPHNCKVLLTEQVFKSFQSKYDGWNIQLEKGR